MSYPCVQVFPLGNRNSICEPIENQCLSIFSLFVVLRLLNHQSLIGLYLWAAKSLINLSNYCANHTFNTGGGSGGAQKGHK